MKPRFFGVFLMAHPVHRRRAATKMTIKTAHNEMNGFQEILERKEAELVRVLRSRDGIAIEKSADQMDEIQNATE